VLTGLATAFDTSRSFLKCLIAGKAAAFMKAKMDGLATTNALVKIAIF
jgi:hypothetical protein